MAIFSWKKILLNRLKNATMIPGRSLVLILIFLCSLSCSSDSEMPEEQETDASCSNESLLEQFTAEGGEVIFIY